MPTSLPASSRFASMTAVQVIAEQQRLMASWTTEDAARRTRNAARLAAL